MTDGFIYAGLSIWILIMGGARYMTRWARWGSILWSLVCIGMLVTVIVLRPVDFSVGNWLALYPVVLLVTCVPAYRQGSAAPADSVPVERSCRSDRPIRDVPTPRMRRRRPRWNRRPASWCRRQPCEHRAGVLSPIDEPRISSFQKIRVRSMGQSHCVVDPQVTKVPRRANERMQALWMAGPTESA